MYIDENINLIHFSVFFCLRKSKWKRVQPTGSEEQLMKIDSLRASYLYLRTVVYVCVYGRIEFINFP